MKTKLLVLFAMCVSLAGTTFAQVTGGPVAPRPDDHFHRRKILMRIDLREKFNRPMIHRQGSNYDQASNAYRYNEGLVSAMLTAYENGEVLGYVPDTLDQPLTWDVFASAYRRVGISNPGSETDNVEVNNFPEEDPDNNEFPDFEEFPMEDEWPTEEPTTEPNVPAPGGFTADDRLNMVAALASYIEVVEDRIFDANRSDQYYDVQYVRLMYVDPEGILPDRPMVTFRYQDLTDLLENTRCNNRWNDAEYRSMRETFDQRSFHAFIISISGNEMLTLDQSAQHADRLTEFEHNLWQY